MSVSAEKFRHDPFQLTSGTGGGGSGDIEGRLRDVENRLTAIETELKHMATKKDLEEMLSKMLKWGVSILSFSSVSMVVAIFS